MAGRDAGGFAGTALAALLASGCAGFAEAMAKQAESDRTVMLTINGLVVGPADQGGRAWDGPPLSPDDVNAFAGLVIEQFPVGKAPVLGELATDFAGKLANTAIGSFEAPDPVAVLTFRSFAMPVRPPLNVELPKQQNRYTAQWNWRTALVPIHKAAIDITVWDADLTDNDLIGQVTITEAMMLAAETTGGPYNIDTLAMTGGMIQRVQITVSPN